MDKESEHDPDLVENMIYKLTTGADYMEDLVSVLKQLGDDYKLEEVDKDKYFEFDAQEKRKHTDWVSLLTLLLTFKQLSFLT